MKFSKQHYVLLLPLILILVWPHGLTAADGVIPFQSDVFITKWLVCGPFPNDNSKTINYDFLQDQGSELTLVPKVGMRHSSSSVPEGSVAWRAANADASGKLDFVKLMAPNQKNVTYAFAALECSKRTPAILKLGSNDRMKVWLNGQLVQAYLAPRSTGPDADNIPVVLQKGENRLLAKVDNEGANWYMFARLQELVSVDDRLYVLPPAISQVPKQTENGGLADMISVLAFNMSDTSVGPVTLDVAATKTRKPVQTTCAEIKPQQITWLAVESEVIGKTDDRLIAADLVISTEKGKHLFPLREKRSPLTEGTVYLVPGLHVDPVWLEGQAGYQKITFANVYQFLRAAEADTSFQIFLHEIPYLKPYYDAYPHDRAFIRHLIKQGRIATGGSYNQPNETTISGEALIRNIIYGRLFHENVLGDYPQAYAPWDVFGHIIQLPQILKKSEFIGAAFTRSNYRDPSVRVPDVPSLYWAVAPDGSKLLFRKVDYGFDWRGYSFDMSMSARQKLAAMLQEQQKQVPGIKSELILEANDEKAPTTWMIGRCNEFKTYIPEVKMRASGMADYFKAAAAQIKTDALDVPQVSRDESQYNEGCELSRFDLKMGNRLAENTLISAEKFATIANLLGASYPAAALDRAWRHVLYGQHHDGITGCGSDIPYLDLAAGYHEALELSGNALKDALQQISSAVKTRRDGDLVPIVVYNALNWQRDDIVQAKIDFIQPAQGFEIIDEKGRRIESIVEATEVKDGKISSARIAFLAEQMPSLGYRTFWARPAAALPARADQKKCAGQTIENAFYRITLDEKLGGGIVSLIDKSSGKEYINTRNGHPGNELIQLKEGNGFEPSWRFLTTGKKFFSKDTRCQFEIVENPLYQRIIVTGEMPRMKKRVQEITLYRTLRRIDFRTSLVDYAGLQGMNIIEKIKHDDRDFYCIGFPADLKGAVPVLEDRFGVKSYYPSKEYLNFYSSSRAWDSHHSMNSCYQWMDLGYSVRVKCGESSVVAVGPCEIVTPRNERLRQAGFELQTALAKSGVTGTPGYDTVNRDYDIQYRRFSFSIGAKGENKYNEKLVKTLAPAVRKQIESQLSQHGYAYVLAEDTNLPEAWFPLPVLMIIGSNTANAERAAMQLAAQLGTGFDINLPSAVIATTRAMQTEEQGLAILNRGNISVSTEPDGSMILSLMHITPWQNPHLTWTHDFPERKTHVFDYAVLPHQGDWREANLVRSGYEFNNPLIAVQTDLHDGSLPATNSFFNTGNANVVITAIKPRSAGNEALQKSKATDAGNGVVVRFYECAGKDGKISLNASWQVKKAELVNLMERQPQPLPASEKEVAVNVSANGIETVMLALDANARPIRSATTKKVQPAVFARYWQHNEGASPMGYLPVGVRLINKNDMTEARDPRKVLWQLEAAVTNDYVDAAVKGKVRIEAPAGLRILPQEIDYEVPANSERFYSFTVMAESENWVPGFITASIEQNGQRVYDVCEFGVPAKGLAELEWRTEQKKDRVVISIKNPFGQMLEGQVALIGPVESWGLDLVNPIALNEVSPWRQDFAVPAKGEVTLEFAVRANGSMPSADVTQWLVAKLSCYGYVDYKAAWGDLEIKGQVKELE
jgi:alpha-mannosidase